jgi:hypothetical protein
MPNKNIMCLILYCPEIAAQGLGGPCPCADPYSSTGCKREHVKNYKDIIGFYV